jgi:RNA polymerase sigma-70 factor (ECF subfamily)
MRRHNQRLYRVIRALITDPSEVEDVMQHAYVAAFIHLDQYAERALFSTWLCRIGVNEALARIRHGRRERLRVVEDTHEEVAEVVGLRAESPEETASRRELAELLEAAVDRLPEIYRLVFLLREVEEMSVAESAECLGVSEDVIKVRLHRARRLLRDALGDGLRESAPEAFLFHAPRCDRVVANVFAHLAGLR